uniref:Uncharacterized protein n=1 Tax=Alloyangia mangrovi TaxID=1779329 RepID=A0A2A3JQA8_9RHOB
MDQTTQNQTPDDAPFARIRPSRYHAPTVLSPAESDLGPRIGRFGTFPARLWEPGWREVFGLD